MVKTLLLSCLVCLIATASASAQPQPQPPTAAPGGGLLQSATTTQLKWEQVEEGHLRLVGEALVEPPGTGIRLSADTIDLFTKDDRIVASGNVVFVNPEGRIAAETVEFNAGSGTGTFHQATGLMSLGPKADRKQFGDQDPDVYFWGETIEKVSARKYKITRGGFTTCVQPTPRWELRTGNVTLNLNDYAIARNTVLRVKGVPLMYLPIVYYPIQNGDRATGFLLPTYGTSTLRGQAISNAFFWAIGRSQDATFFHDWFTRTGQGAGAEYRYVAGPQSNGTLRYFLMNQRATQFTVGNTVTALKQDRSYEVTGVFTHVLTPRLRARARIDYVSSIVSQQLYNQNVARATNPIRTVEGNLSGAWKTISTNASFQRTETFSSATRSQVYGGTPRITTTLSPQQLFGLPIYAGLNSEYAYLPYRSINDGVVTTDRSLTRVDVAPTARIPLSTLSFFTVNSSATYRTTYYSRSTDASGAMTDEPLTRRYLALRTGIIGPVMTKVWDTPESMRTQRMKHVIEPTLTVDYFTDITNYRATPVLTDATDRVIGGMAQYTYGINNRLFYRSRAVEGERSSTTREFVTVGLQQTYYTRPEARDADPQYTSRAPRPADLSPVSLTARVSPTTLLDANSRIEYDVSGQGLQLFSLGSSVSSGGSTSNITFSRTRSSRTDPTSTYLSGSTSLAFRQNRFRATYALSWDIARGYVVSQRTTGSYLAQCCGLEVEFQDFNYPSTSAFPIAADRRVNFSFILAGLGTFSNFFGAFGGQR